MRSLYSGSVTSSNVAWILALSNVGGVLIGGASLIASDFDAALDVNRQISAAPGCCRELAAVLTSFPTVLES